MAGTRELEAAKASIIDLLEGSAKRVFAQSDLAAILSRDSGRWGLPESVSARRFVDFLVEETKLERFSLGFPSRNMIRYTWGDVSPYAVASSLGPSGYFSHFSALYLNGLTEQLPKTLYLNQEQSPKPKASSPLAQERIDSAFRRPQRMSQNVAVWEGVRLCLLSGMSTGRLGVIGVAGLDGAEVPVTNVERTLVDITVRPAYAGGVFEVLKAFTAAQPTVSVNGLCAILRRLEYTYPYHQAIGYYVERSGAYSRAQIDLLRQFPMEYDFYLTHQMGETEYCREWRLFVPKGF